MHVYEVRPREDKRGFDLISDVLPFGRLWYEGASAAVDYAKHSSRSHDAVIRVYDEGRQRHRDTRAQGRFQKVCLTPHRPSTLRSGAAPGGGFMVPFRIESALTGRP